MKKRIILQTSLRGFLEGYPNYSLGRCKLKVVKVQAESCFINQLFPNGVDESEWEKWTGAMATAHLRLTIVQDDIRITENYVVDNHYFRIESFDSTNDSFIIQIEGDIIPVSRV